MKILTHPDPGLRKKSEPVDKIDESIRSLVDNMVEKMFKADGMGLAAPQVGEYLRIFVVDVEDDFHVFVNPEVTSTGGKEETAEEGCLSVPGVNAEVTRPNQVEIEGYDLDGEKFKLNREGMAARVVQHEMDHLKGILFFDRLSDARRSLLMSEYEKQESEKKEKNKKGAL